MQDEALNYFGGNELAASVWKSKYAAAGELTPEDMHLRMARELSPVMSRFDAKYTEDYVMGLLRDFSFIVPQGSIMSGLGVAHVISSLSNCFVIESPYDSYGGIMLADEHLVQLMKRRGGVGVDISTLRPKSAPVKNAAKTSTGAASFMERFSTSTREVAQSGRRGALMLTIDIRHPDSTDFINAKQDRTKVTGANISVMLRDDFMQAVKNGEDYLQRWPCDISPELDSGVQLDRIPYGELVKGALGYYKKVRAQDVYKQIVHNAWDNAEPGQIFINRMWDYSSDGVYPSYKTITTNPCCFAESSRVDVVTNNGIKDIREVTSADLVWLEGECKFTPNSGYFQVGSQPVFDVELSNGERLTITANHKLAKINPKRIDGKINKAEFDLVELSNLTVGDEIRVHVGASGVFGSKGTYDDGLILGWLSGDGALSYQKSGDSFPTMYLDFWQQEYDAGETVLQACRSIGLDNKQLEFKNNGNAVRRIGSCRLTQYYTEKFEHNIWQWRKGRNPILYDMSRDFIKGYLQSYFTADGTVQVVFETSYFSIQLSSIERDRLEQVQMLLAQFGIKSSIGVMKAAGNFSGLSGSYETKECYRLTITGIDNLLKFKDEIGFLAAPKQEKLESLSQHNPMYSKYSTYAKIRSIKYKGEEMVGCIEVPDYHYFTANSIVSGNSEIGMGAFDACRLVALNFLSFVSNPFTASASLNAGELYDKSYDMQIMADAIVDLELGHIDRILAHIASSKEPENVKSRELELWQNIKRVAAAGRRTGCGFTALGDALAAMGIKYDSEQAVDRTREMVSTKMRAELNATIDLAEKFGPFTGWDPSIEKNKLFDFIAEEFPAEYARMQKVGRRNVSWSTVAPTGTVSLLTQTSSGLEPMFQPFYTRRRKINPSEEGARIDFTDQNGDNWMEYPVLEPQFKNWMLAQGVSDPENKTPSEIKALFEKSPWFGCCANDIDWKYRIALQAVIQKYTTHSLSSTINLPSDVTEETVAEIYLAAWEAGLKGVTVYRDGCRTGVLVTTTQEEFAEHNAPKRPKSLKAKLHHVSVMGDKYTIVVGTMNGKPYEVFATPGNYGKTELEGFVVKKSRGHYSFVVNEVDVIENVLIDANDELDALTRLTSTALRHGASLDFVAEQLGKTTGAVVSPAKAIARVLRKYQKTATAAVCDNCGSSELVMSEGCQSCKSCGNSKCS